MQSLITARCSPVTLPERRFIPDDQLTTKLLAITLEGLPKAKPLRRSQLARRDYVPEPVVVLPEPKKSLLQGTPWPGSTDRHPDPCRPHPVRDQSGYDWFDDYFFYGELKPDYHELVVGDVSVRELSDGRKVRTCFRGKLPSFSARPPLSNSKIGDIWWTEKDGSYWVLEPVSAISSIGRMDRPVKCQRPQG